MNQREKILAGLIGGLLIIIAVVFFGDMYLDERAKLASDIKAYERQREEQDGDIDLGIRATEDLQVMEQLSLPWDVEDAQRLYQAWLLHTLDKKVGFEGPDVATGLPKNYDDVYMSHQFTVTCKGDVEKFTKFLYHFYDADLLHYFDNVSVRQIRESRDLSLTFTIRAIAMPNADSPDVLMPESSGRLASTDVQDYVQSIAYRNPFSLKNNQPKLSISSSQEVTLGSSLSLEPSASDPDKGDKVTFAADLEELEGARISSSSGRISWRPKELGEYRLTVYATDNGFPPETTARDVTVRVVEPKKEEVVEKKPEFDTAKLAIVSGIVRSGGKPQVWVALRSEGRILKLHEGDPIEVGQTNGVVKSITQRRFQFQTEDGEMKVVELGQNLAEAQTLSSGE